MNSLYILIPLALIFTALAVYLYFWSVGNKQYDDLDSAAYSILFDNDSLDRKSNGQKNRENTDQLSDDEKIKKSGARQVNES
jgi:cbb3-type cytochrome oxidase maturation protein